MRKNIKLRKLLIFSIVILFFGIAMLPSISSISITHRSLVRGIPRNSKFVDEFPPIISDIKINTRLTIVGKYVNISANVTDNIGLADVCILIIYPDSHWENFSIFQNKTGDTFSCNDAYEMLGEYYFDIWAIDVNGNTAIRTGCYFIITELLLTSADGPYEGFNDVPIEFHGCAAGGIEPYEWLWDFGDGYYSIEQNPVHTYTDIGLFIVVLSVTDKNANIAEDTTTATISFNLPPSAPMIIGPKNGKVGVEIEYIFNSVDPEDDDVYYHIKWGCGGCSEYHIYGPYPSGMEVIISHKWDREGDYTIQAFAKDGNGAESDEITFDVSIPRIKVRYSFHILFKLLDMLPRIKTMLNL